MKYFRLKHLKTGLYFGPSKRVSVRLPDTKEFSCYVKTNLHKNGKVYFKKWWKSGSSEFMYSHLEVEWTGGKFPYAKNKPLYIDIDKDFAVEYLT